MSSMNADGSRQPIEVIFRVDQPTAYNAPKIVVPEEWERQQDTADSQVAGLSFYGDINQVIQRRPMREAGTELVAVIFPCPARLGGKTDSELIQTFMSHAIQNAREQYTCKHGRSPMSMNFFAAYRGTPDRVESDGGTVWEKPDDGSFLLRLDFEAGGIQVAR